MVTKDIEMIGKSFWNKEVTITLGRLIGLFLLFIVISGLLIGVFLNYVFPRLTFIPWLRIVAPNFPVIVNRTDEVRIVEGVNVQKVYSEVRPVTVSLVLNKKNSSPATINSLTRSGGGIIASSDGLILTTKSAIGTGEDSVDVVLENGSVYVAIILAQDPRSDLAIIKINAENLAIANFGASGSVSIGAKLVALTSSLNNSSAGVNVVNFLRGPNFQNVFPSIRSSDAMLGYIVTTPDVASLGQGMAIADGDAKVVGLAGSTGIIPGEYLERVINLYLKDKQLKWPELGLQYQTITPAIAILLALPKQNGILLTSVPGQPAIRPGGAAALAGLREGDLIYKIGNNEIIAQMGVEEIFEELNIKNPVAINFMRGSEDMSTTLTPQ